MTPIRSYQPGDWPELWDAVIEPVVRAGDSYPYATDMDSMQAREAWIEKSQAVYVAVDANGHLVGTYYIRPNQPPLGAHVCNCGFMVAAARRGQGIGTSLCVHALDTARSMGFRAMQFNLVLAGNAAAIHIYRQQGFSIVGTLPGAFLHRTRGYVDALVMYRSLLT